MHDVKMVGNIVFKRPDGTIYTVGIRGKPTLEEIKSAHPEFSEEQANAQLKLFLDAWPTDSKHHADQLFANGSVPADYEAVAFDYPIPTDEFDEARIWDGEKISHSLALAKEVKKTLLRRQRKPLMEELDVQFMRLLEQGGNTKQIVDQKNKLRDATNAVDKASSLDDLRKIKI